MQEGPKKSRRTLLETMWQAVTPAKLLLYVTEGMTIGHVNHWFCKEVITTPYNSQIKDMENALYGFYDIILKYPRPNLINFDSECGVRGSQKVSRCLEVHFSHSIHASNFYFCPDHHQTWLRHALYDGNNCPNFIYVTCIKLRGLIHEWLKEQPCLKEWPKTVSNNKYNNRTINENQHFLAPWHAYEHLQQWFHWGQFR